MFLVFVVLAVELSCLPDFDFAVVSVALRVGLARVELVNLILQAFVCPLSRFSLELLLPSIIGTHSQKLLPFVDH